MSLADKKCRTCEGFEDKFSEEEEEGYLEKMEGWTVDRSGVHKIRKSFEFEDFKEALQFVNEVGQVAEEEGHHPNIGFTWGKVTIEIWTHAVDGLTENDFILAAKIDEL